MFVMINTGGRGALQCFTLSIVALRRHRLGFAMHLLVRAWCCAAKDCLLLFWTFQTIIWIYAMSSRPRLGFQPPSSYSSCFLWQWLFIISFPLACVIPRHLQPSYPYFTSLVLITLPLSGTTEPYLCVLYVHTHTHKRTYACWHKQANSRTHLGLGTWQEPNFWSSHPEWKQGRKKWLIKKLDLETIVRRLQRN